MSSSMLDSAAGVSISKVGKWEGMKRGFGGGSGNSGVGGNVSEADRWAQVCPQQEQH